MKKTGFIFFSILLLVSGMLIAQENPFRIGLKVGLPNVVGLNAEFVTPIRLAPTGDFSYLSFSVGNTGVSFSYFEIGSNYYFKSDGRGFYGHLSYGSVGFNGSYTRNSGSGKGEIDIDLLNAKVGGKFGRRIYFRPEVGFGFLLGDTRFRVTYPDGTTEQRSVPSFLAGGPLINLGFGVAF